MSGTEPFSVDWLMHGREEMVLDPDNQLIESSRFEEGMRTQILTTGMFDFSLTNEWPIDPKQDYPMVTAAPPAKEWHFSATTRDKAEHRRIAAIMMVKENGKYPECDVKSEDGLVYITGHSGEDKWSGTIQLDHTKSAGSPLLELDYIPVSGGKESIRIPK